MYKLRYVQDFRSKLGGLLQNGTALLHHLDMVTGAGFHAEGRHLQALLQELTAVGATRGHIFKPKQLRLDMLCYVMVLSWDYPAC